MVDLSKFDDEKLDPDFPTELDPQIISLLFDRPLLAEQILPHLKPTYFHSFEAQAVAAEILNHHAKHGTQPTRDIVWSTLLPQLEAGDPHEQIKELVFRKSIGRELCHLKEQVFEWVKKRTVFQLYNDETGEAINRGDYNILRRIADETEAIGAEAESNGFMKPSELFAPSEDEEWLIDNVIAPHQPCIIGGPSKSMKTSLLCDLAISMASGKPFLGKYKSRQSQVLFISGESGKTALRNTMGAIMRRRCITAEAIEEHLLVSFDLPLLSTDTGLAGLRKALQKHQPEVVILDPLYLCLLSSDDAGSASNIFAMGTKLGVVSRLCQELGVTPILCHHFNRKGTPGSWPSLADLSQAGASEFARQWILLRRAREYNHDGLHELNVILGGGDARSKAIRLSVNEGQEDRDWKVEITPREELEQDERAGKRDKQAEKGREEEQELLDAIYSLTQAGRRATASRLRRQLNWRPEKFNRVMDHAMDQHKVLEREDPTEDRRESGLVYQLLEEPI